MKVRSYLNLIALSTIVPLVLICAVGLHLLLTAQRETALATLRESARATAVSVDMEFGQAEAALRVLASSANLAQHDFAAFHEQARTAVLRPGSWIVLLDHEGRQLVNTAAPRGTPLPMSSIPAETRQQLGSGKPVVLDLQRGALTKKWLGALVIPVKLPEGEIMALAYNFDASVFARTFPARAADSAWLYGLFDHQGKTVVRNRGPMDYIGALPNPDLLDALRGAGDTILRNQSRDGLQLYTAVAHAPFSGWSVAVGAPKSEIDDIARNAVMLFAAGIIAAAAIGTVAAAFFGRRLIASIGALQTALGELTEDHAPRSGRSGIAEMDSLSQLQQRVAVSLLERQQTTRRELEHLRELMEQAPGFNVFFRGPEHVYEIANAAYYDLVGQRNLIGKSVRDALPEVEGQGFFELLDRVFQTGEPFVGRSMPAQLRLPGSVASVTRYIDFVFQPVFDRDGTVTGVFSQGTDVTVQKMAIDELHRHRTQLEMMVEERSTALAQTREALQHAQKLESLGKLTGGVAHDFNNVLHLVAVNLDLLQRLLPANEKARKRIEVAQRAVTRGAKLSSQLLSFARRQALLPVVTDIGKFIGGIDEMLRQVLGADIDIDTSTGGGLWRSEVDRSQLENVLVNLAVNARDAMPDGGKLTIEIGNAVLDIDYAATQVDVTPGQYVLLALSDTGVGMSPEVLQRAIEPFFTTKGEGAGTGLGLSMAYGFAKQSGGHLRLYSEPGFGTTVKLYLPRTVVDEAVSAPDQPSLAGGAGEVILVVEDEHDLRLGVSEMLTGLGYQVLTAANGAEGLAIVRSSAHLDLIFTDVVMPGAVRSVELAREAKTLRPELEILFTSGYTQNAIMRDGRLDDGVTLLSKPYRRDQLAAAISSLLGRRRGKRNPPSA